MEPPVNRPAYPGSAANTGPQYGKRVPILGSCLDPSRSEKFRLLDRLKRDSCRDSSALVELCPRRVPARDYASAVGVGTGSDCVATARERGRLGLDLVGADAASPSTFALDLERLVRPGLDVAS